jgi:asparagine synthetase B (glutamine-hydrolysing)
MLENSGFLFVKNRTVIDKAFIESINNSYINLPEEYGNHIIEKCKTHFYWSFFLPGKNNYLNIDIFYDDNIRLILFAGGIYSNKDKTDIRDDLLSIHDEISLKIQLNNLSGSFCGIIFNYKDNVGYAFTDRMGVQKIFYTINENKLIISSNLTIIRNIIEDIKFSDLSFSSICYCGHIFKDSIIDKVKQISPGCAIHFDNEISSEYEYPNYPKRLNLNLNDSVELVAKAHREFWERIGPNVDGNIACLLSRGKDSRVILKHMIQKNIKPFILIFYRKNNPLKPFITFNLNFDEDSNIAITIATKNDLKYRLERIDNKYLLNNLYRIIALSCSGITPT